MMGKVIFYPRGWVHNANVYGFLKVLSEHGVDVSSLLKDDGTLVIDEKLAEFLYEKSEDHPRLYEWWIDSSDKLGIVKRDEKYDPFVNIPRRFFMNDKKLYRNLIPQRGEAFNRELLKFVSYIFSEPNLDDGDRVCVICGDAFSFDEEYSKYHQFTSSLFGDITSFIGGFPNAFWNMKEQYVCKKCAQMALFRHFVFLKNGDVFINAPSFKVIWYLNKAAEVYMSKDVRETLGLSLVHSALKINRILGAWSRQNVEIVRYQNGFYEISFLPPRVIDSLLDGEVYHALSSLNNRRILDHVLSEKHSMILRDAYIVLKSSFSQKKDIEKSLSNIRAERVFLLSQLYLALRRIYEGVENLISPLKMRELGRQVKEDFENTKYRLLELIRLGKRSEAYHLILRTYMASGREFPEELSKVFSVDDEEQFKALMFAYMSGFSGGEEE